MTDFDTIASEYDAQFSSSKIGIKQRQRVWKYLLRHTFSEQRVLELNCGTGIDAQFLGKRCLSVHATDLSTEMIATAKSRNSQDNVSFQKLGIQYLSEVNNEYDLIFSNFGGLNCISPEEWSIAAKEIHRLLSKNGSFIAVIMSRKCLWERFYFRLKKDSKNQRKVIKGGSWKDAAYFLRVSTRDYEYKAEKRSYIGFRTVQDYLGEDGVDDRNQNKIF